MMSDYIKLNWKRLVFVNLAIIGITNRFLYIIKGENRITLKIAIEKIEGLTYKGNEFLVHEKNENDLHLHMNKRNEIFQAIKHAYFGLT